MARNLKADRDVPCVKDNSNTIDVPVEISEALMYESIPTAIIIPTHPGLPRAFDSSSTPHSRAFDVKPIIGSKLET